MTLCHPPFGQFKSSFKPTICLMIGWYVHTFIYTYWTSQVDDNVYQGTTYPSFHGGLARDLPPPNQQGICLVEFKQHADFELPSRSLLGIHAALAWVMHASGMGERIEKILCEWRMLRCPAPDGSTDVNSFWSYPEVTFFVRSCTFNCTLLFMPVW